MKRLLWLVGLFAVTSLAGGAYLPAAEKGVMAAALPKSVTVLPVVITPSENFVLATVNSVHRTLREGRRT